MIKALIVTLLLAVLRYVWDQHKFGWILRSVFVQRKIVLYRRDMVRRLWLRMHLWRWKHGQIQMQQQVLRPLTFHLDYVLALFRMAFKIPGLKCKIWTSVMAKWNVQNLTATYTSIQRNARVSPLKQLANVYIKVVIRLHKRTRACTHTFESSIGCDTFHFIQ